MAENSKKAFYQRKRFWLAIIYVGLFAWSGIYRYNAPEFSVSPDKKTILLRSIDGKEKLSEKIRVTYREFPPEKETGKLPVILLHGSPGSAGVFDGVVKFLEKDRRYLAIDLPGFGDSEKDVPDYSIKAHSQYILQLLDKLNIEKAHFVGFSLGGGVVLHVAETEPDRVASISFIASIGVQEYELLGDYHLNHIAHGIQLALFWAFQELTPHFGIFDGGIPYARNFYDTDQRPLRNILKEIEPPFQIIHGRDDPLVPSEAAREHFRLVPQSEYIELDDNHFFIFMRPEKLEKPLESFWERVEDQTAKTRKNADANRIAQADQPFEFQIIPARGATAFVFLILIIILTFLSEDLAFLLAGVLSAQGRFGLTFAIIACLFGAYLANFLSLLIGRCFGEKILQTAPFSLIFNRSGIKEFSENPENKSLITNILSRPFFGCRIPFYFATGVLRKRFWKYLSQFLLASTIWATLFAGFSYFMTKGLIQTAFVNQQETFILFALILAFYLLFRFLIRFFEKKS